MPKKIPQLDAVRGLAILLVMFHNTTDKYSELHLQRVFASGWMGVDLFFVLSGFLITGILLDSRQSDGYFRNFYARRALRIWPLYYSILFTMFVLVPLLQPPLSLAIFSARSSPWWAYPLFLQNFLVAIPHLATGPLGVSWSLAIEEQFYLFWPWIVRYCGYRQLRGPIIAVICLSPALRFYLTLQHANIYSNFFCRLDGLMAGAFLALLVRSRGFQPQRWVRPAWVSLLLAVPLALATDALQMRWLVHSLVVAAAFSLVYLALFSQVGWFQRLMMNRFLVYTGTISFALYLTHKLVFDALASFLAGRPALIFTAGFASSYSLAILSWSLLERPFLRLKRFFVLQPSVL